MPITTPVLSYLLNQEKTLPMLLIEVPTSAGRSYQGYKRGGKAELKERIFEETLGAIVWLSGVKAFNKIGNVIGEKLLGLKDLGTDVGKDSLRRPFENVTYKPTATAIFKFSKIVGSALLGTLAMGLVVPKIKIAMTNALRMKNGQEPISNNKTKDGEFKMGPADKIVAKFIKYDKNKIKSNKQLHYLKPNAMYGFVENAKKQNSGAALSFKGITDKILYASHSLENKTSWRLLSTDVGTLAGRVATSRDKKEKIEYLVRDSLSSIAYIFAAPFGSTVLGKVLKTPDIHPKAAKAAGEKVIEVIKNSGGAINNKALSSKFNLGEEGKKLLSSMRFSSEDTIFLDDFNAQTNNLFAKKAELMSQLQPKIKNADGIKASILSKKQVSDILSSSETSDPIFLKKAISLATYGKSDDPKKFVQRKYLEKIRDSFDDYVKDLEKYAAKKVKDGQITESIVQKYTKNLNRKNLLIYLGGRAFAVLLLAFLIPKFQCFMSTLITGKSEFIASDSNKN